MKSNPKTPLKSGFTLVELLVVIAIIAVLAAAGFAGGNAAMQKARKVSAQAVASSLETNVESFYSDYSALPFSGDTSPSTDTEYKTGANGNGIPLLEVLAGIESGDDVQNDRKIRYLNVKDAKNDRDGIAYNTAGDSILGLYDPWGEPYTIILDYDYNEKLEVTPLNNPKVNLNGRRVAVYSLGTDTPSDANSKTLVKTW